MTKEEIENRISELEARVIKLEENRAVWPGERHISKKEIEESIKKSRAASEEFIQFEKDWECFRAVRMAAVTGVSRQIGKKGIVVDGDTYVAVELVGREGETVKVLHNPAPGTVRVCNEDGSFLCIAINPELSGINRHELARKLKEEQVRQYKQKVKDARLKAKDSEQRSKK